MNINLENLELETERALNLFRSNNISPSILEQQIQSYVKIQWLRYIELISKNNYKMVYKLLRQLINVLGQNLKFLSDQLAQLIPTIKEPLLTILDEGYQYKESDKIELMQKTIKIAKFEVELFNYDSSQLFDIYQENLFMLISCFNNLGYIYVLRNKLSQGLCYFFRAIVCRSFIINNQQCFYQQIILEQNIAICFRLQSQYQSTTQLLNKTIAELESLEEQKGKVNYRLETTAVLSLVNFYCINKFGLEIQKPKQIAYIQIVYQLCLSYYYYAKLFEQISKPNEQNSCRQYYESLIQLYTELNPKQRNKINIGNDNFRPELQEEQLNMEKQEQKIDNKNEVNEISDSEVIMYYTMIEEYSIKIIFTLYEKKQCIEILIYSLENDFMKKYYIGCNQLIEQDLYDQETYIKLMNCLNIDIENWQIKIEKYKTFESIEGCVSGYQYYN